MKFESMGVDYDGMVNSKEMQGWIRKKKSRLLEIETENKKKEVKPLVVKLKPRTRTPEEQESLLKKQPVGKLVSVSPISIYDDSVHNRGEMQERVTKKRFRFHEIESEKKKNDEEFTRMRLKPRIKKPRKQEEYFKRDELLKERQAMDGLVLEPFDMLLKAIDQIESETQKENDDKKRKAAAPVLAKAMPGELMNAIAQSGIESQKENDKKRKAAAPVLAQAMPGELMNAIAQSGIETQKENGKKRKDAAPVLAQGMPGELMNAIPQSGIETQKENGKKRKAAAPVLAQGMPGELMNAISRQRGENVMWVIEKPLHRSDVRKGQNRLSIPVSQVNLEDHLTDEEKTQISMNSSIPVDVLVLVSGDNGPHQHQHQHQHQPQLWSMNFNRWRMSSQGIYVLQTNWWKLVDDNKLVDGDKVQVWSFRRSQNGEEKKKLSFAINAIRTKKMIDIY